METKWISVKERLPEYNELVLVFWADKERLIAQNKILCDAIQKLDQSISELEAENKRLMEENSDLKDFCYLTRDGMPSKRK